MSKKVKYEDSLDAVVHCFTEEWNIDRNETTAQDQEVPNYSRKVWWEYPTKRYEWPVRSSKMKQVVAVERKNSGFK